jgi:hypothetical protein
VSHHHTLSLPGSVGLAAGRLARFVIDRFLLLPIGGRWTMPIVAAAGGSVGGTGVYLAFINWKYELLLSRQLDWP